MKIWKEDKEKNIIMNTRPRIKSVDSIRGIASCIVAFFWHYQHFQPEFGSPFKSIFMVSYEYGWLMVELFFIISGFMMSYQYKETIINEKISLAQYFKKRFFHIWPLMFVTLLVVAIQEFVYQLMVGETFVYGGFDLYHFVLNLLMIQNGWIDNSYSFNGPAWCISIELFCYLVFWFVLKKTNENSLLVKYVLLVVIGVGICQKGLDYPLLNISTARGLMGFFVGCILYELYIRCEGEKKALNRFLVIFIGAIYGGIRLYGYNWLGNVHFIFVLFIAPVIIWLVISRGIIRNVLELNLLVCLGKCSMHIYLWHFPVQCTFKLVQVFNGWNIDYSDKKVFLIYVFTTLLVAVASYNLTGYVSKRNRKVETS